MQAREGSLQVNVLRSAWLRRAAAGTAVGFCVTALAATFAKVHVLGTPLLPAAAEAGRDLLSEPLGIAFLAVPFATLAALAPMFALGRPSPGRWAVIGVGVLSLTLFYFKGFIGSELALEQRKWTAAALSVGLMPFISLLCMLLAAFAASLAHLFAQLNRGKRKAA
jgi:hypothetical protein